MVGHRLEHATLAAEEERTLAEAVDREPIVAHRGGDPSHALTARAAPDIWAAVQRSVAAWRTSDEASVHCYPVPAQLPVVTSPAHLAHDGLLEVMGGRPVPCYEKPERISAIERALMDTGGHRFMPVREHGLRPITDVHEPALVDLLEHVWTDAIASGATDGAAPLIPDTFLVGPLAAGGFGGEGTARPARLGAHCLDTATPIVAGTYLAARAAVDVALTAAEIVLDGESLAYGLCRPPGHHAAQAMYGGYCFFNNAAIVAEHLCATGATRVAILDI